MRSWAGRHPRWLAVGLVILALLVVWATHLWQLSRSVEQRARYWATPRGESGGLLYVALGDSAAQGIGASRPERGYVGLVADELRRSSGRPVQIINLSRSGAKVRDVVAEQLPALAGLSPDLVTVGVGGNDVSGYEPASFARDAKALMTGLPDGTVVADAPYFMHGRWRRDAGAVTDALTEQARLRGLTVAPLQQTTRAAGWQAMFTDYAADWFHPNDRGYQRWFQAFWSVIEPLPVASGQRVQYP